MSETSHFLKALGWGPAFASQLDAGEYETAVPVRVSAVHRNGVDVLGEDGPCRVETGADLPTDQIAVGDWVLADRGDGGLRGVLERKTCLQRRAAGTGRAVQLIAANIDTLFIVSSCNADFNLARLERYLALAAQAGVMPVVVLSKADTCDDPQEYLARAQSLSPMLVVEAIDGRDREGTARLLAWCGEGQTVALLGSSGVGKSTLINSLTGAGQETGAIREDDAKGRHVTTARSLHAMASGGWLIDTPGMRALRLYDAAEGVGAVFADITDLAASCRYADCGHESEPDCAVRAAVQAGDLDAARVDRWHRLEREEARNTASIAEQRQHSKALGRMYKSAKAQARGRKGR